MSAGKVLVTGSAGFIGGYVVEELLRRGYEVVGVDNHSKYGPVRKSYDDDPRYTLVEGDAREVDVLTEALAGCDHLIAGAAMIGGISYFHTYAYDLLATNERIIASTCDAAIAAHREGRLQKVTYLSSSMVFESTPSWPSYEGQELDVPPPLSSYGFQKLAVEYFARAAYDQHGLPYTIVRPFNCVGIGEMRALGDIEVVSGNVKLAMSHVVPDLVQKIVKGQDPLHILGDGSQVRHYTYGGDLARGIVTGMEHPAALNDDFNLSTPTATSVLELAENIWHRLRGDAPFRTVSDAPFENDVQMPRALDGQGALGPGFRSHDDARRDARHRRAVGGRRRRARTDLAGDRSEAVLARPAADRARRARAAHRLRDAGQADRTGARRPDLLQRAGQHHRPRPRVHRLPRRQPAGRAPTAHRAGAHADLVGDGAVRPGWEPPPRAAPHHDRLRGRGGAAHRVDRPDRRRRPRRPHRRRSGRGVPEPLDQRRPGDVGDAGHAGGGAGHPAHVPVHPRAPRRRPRPGWASRAGWRCWRAPSSGCCSRSWCCRSRCSCTRARSSARSASSCSPVSLPSRS